MSQLFPIVSQFIPAKKASDGNNNDNIKQCHSPCGKTHTHTIAHPFNLHIISHFYYYHGVLSTEVKTKYLSSLVGHRQKHKRTLFDSCN